MAEETAEESIRRLQQIGYKQRLPGTDEEAAKVEELLADEISKLSMSEQDVVSFEVHGIATEVEETPELVARSLILLETELQSIKDKTAYEKALEMNPTYVTDQRFRLQFLRCEGFNCKNAAKRIILHFQQKEELFGSGDVLARDVRLSDMDPNDLEDMKNGAIQVLPSCDVSGRAILCIFLSKLTGKPRVKGVDENMAKKGIVVLLYFVGKKKKTSLGFDIVKNVYQIRLAVPHRLDAMHICYDDKALRPFISGVRFFLDKRGRTRCRVHFGVEARILFQLQTYGIPIPDDSPLKQVHGVFPLTWHHEWLQNRQAQEMKLAGTGETPKILIPHRFDVLFGRGVKVRSHTGNLRAVHLVSMWQSRYDGALNRSRKAEISDRIVGIIHESSGRFLKWEETGWVEVSDEEAKDKVAHWFRNQRQAKAAESDVRKQTAAQKRNRSTTEVTA